jgi:hypothetical protein
MSGHERRSIAPFARGLGFAALSSLALCAAASDFDVGDRCAFALVGCAAPNAPRLVAEADPPKDARQRADALLDDDLPSEQPLVGGLRGFYQFEGAYTLPSPAHWSKLKNRLEVGTQGQFSESLKWKATVRADYDAAYNKDFYNSDVRHDQRFDFQVRETYLDASAGNFDLRLGRQQIVWGEVVGLFFADVVSAKDLRESVATDFDLLRIPQYAARGEYFVGDTHLEAIWIPFPTVNDIGKPGADFYPFPPRPPSGYGYFINAEQRPKHDWDDQNFGARVSTLYHGWDGALFAYRSVDAQATFLRQIVNTPTPTFVYTPVHEKVTEYGATLSKDLQDFVLKGEAVYAVGREFNVSRLNDPDGVVEQNYVDYIVSAEFTLPSDDRLNLQFFQRRFFNHDPDIIPRSVESGATVFWSKQWGKFTPSILAIHSLNRNDWLLRPRVVWAFDKNWRAAAGADVFGGNRNTGLFGQFDKEDRLYVEVRRSF